MTSYKLNLVLINRVINKIVIILYHNYINCEI